MSFTQQQIDALEKAIAEGVSRVKYQDKEVQYRSLEEMQRILKIMKDSVSGSSPSSGLRVVFSHDKGL